MENKALTLLGFAAKAGKITYGSESCLIGIQKGKIQLVLMAGDISDHTSEKIERACKRTGVSCIKCFNRETLSEAVGKYNKVVLGITDASFSEKIKEYCHME
ncbi:MAG: ribosomal L7Ae/L30e/S12e/Gadd45 family protein [Clostridia bacterium]|nr:ribosomal L7Ae/L30e/S12e/Gadd45 family protein [Clostridia bacterium]